MLTVANWQTASPWTVAQAVQGSPSSDGGIYRHSYQQATTIVAALNTAPTTTGGPSPVAAQAAAAASTCGQPAANAAGMNGPAAWGGYQNGHIPPTELCPVPSKPALQLECGAATAFDQLNTAFKARGRAVRTVPILEPLRPVLDSLVAGRPAGAALVRGPKGGVITTASLRRATNWNALVTGLGLAGLRRHDLRHTGATWMADAGVPLHVLREILGHRSLETTRGYLHADTRHLTDAATAVNAFLSAFGSQTGHSGAPTLRVIDGRR